MHRLALLSLLVLAVAACDSSPSVVEADSTVVAAYEGRLDDGTVFDRSAGTQFKLQETILGFRTNLVGMTIGESKTFTVPPEQGYGSTPRYRNGTLVIPANSTLTFDVTILDIR